jgi:hypothetical protein
MLVLVLLTALIGAGLLMAQAVTQSQAAQTAPRTFKAQSLLLLTPSIPLLGSQRANQWDGTYLDTFRRTQMAIIQSRRVLAKALQDPEVGKLEEPKRQEDPVEWLQSHLQVDGHDSPQLIRVTVFAKNKNDAVRLLKATVAAYVRGFNDSGRAELLKSADRLAKLKDDYDEKLQTSRHQYKALAMEVGLSDPQNQNSKYRLLLDELATAKIDLAQARSARYKLEVELQVLSPKKDTKGEPATPTAIEAVKRKLAVQKTLEEKLISVVKNLSDQTKDMTDSSIDLKDCEVRIKQFERYLNRVSDEAERVRIELDAVPRVVVLDEPG